MPETILVTGVSGFIARHVALELLKSGYAVRGSVRSKAKAASVRESLAKHGGEVSRLSFVEADLEHDDGWKDAVAGCAGVAHVASPFPIEQPRDRNALVPAARGGALRIVDAALEADVPRVVMTSSMVAMMYRPNRPAVMPVGENDWTDLNWEKLSAYVVSKTEAERAAWARAGERGAKERLTTIHPGLVAGPALDKDFGASLEILRLLLKGAYPAVPPVSFPIVDVRDVAALHVASFRAPKTGGRRLIASSSAVSMLDMAKVLAVAAPQHAAKIPKFELPAVLLPILAAFDRRLASILPDIGTVPEPETAYVTELTGLRFRTPKEATIAGAQSLMALGVV